MNIFKNILSIISDISNNKYTADNSIEIGDWIIIDVKLFNKYKNKITINNINYIDSSIVNSLEEYAFKDIRVSFWICFPLPGTSFILKILSDK